jgi:hypothetical protein
MKNLQLSILFILTSLLFFCLESQAQNSVNWTDKQIEAPADLANLITEKKELPVIINIGPGAIIPNSVDVGMVNNDEGIQKLKAQLKAIDKDKKVVVYCGCCPYEHCPNVRPAIDALKGMKFTNYYLLDLPNNIKKDWIDKGYPITKP